MASGRRRLIVVSNRGPVVHVRGPGGERVPRRGGGGLVTALDSLASLHDVTWIASAMSDEDRAVAGEAAAAGGWVEETSRDGSDFRLRLVTHDPAAYASFYDVVANPMLWFVQHGLWDLARTPVLDERFRAAWDTGYATVNRAFAEAVLEELAASPEATVFFHDYHLYLAPAIVRKRVPHALLAHFVHIPWFGPDAWTVLPGDLRRAVHEGLLANDLVGFHTDRWRRAFCDAAAGIAGAERDGAALVHAGRRTLTTARPISVDVEEFDALRALPDVGDRRREVRSDDRALVLRVDRTDPSKNLLRGFRAYEVLLERHPQHRGRVRLLALLDPSRQSIPEYAAYTADVERAAADLNRRAGEPVVELVLADDFHLSVAGYLEYDVLFVNPVFDGLNLVAKEGPLVNERSGVLVLSENAGAAEELGPWALLVSPFDVSEQADALHRALTMPADERRARAAGLRDHVRDHPLSSWVAAILADLDRVAAPVPG